MQRYSAIGVMSGSSLDGLDLAWCEFAVGDGQWTYRIKEARTIPYSDILKQRLLDVMSGTALDLARLHRDIGKLIGEECVDLMNGMSVDLIASHGHTVFHAPEEGLTTQVGCGARIAAATGTTTVCDFRSLDVALGGQGAPLVPLGERILLPAHKAFLNIGGICNISLHGPKHAIGYDVCIGNQGLNFLANEAGSAYDEDGGLARSGKTIPTLLVQLNALAFHHKPPPRSLGREWFEAELRPLISDRTFPVNDRLRTVVEHIAEQVQRASTDANCPILVTGGGAFNSFLIECIRTRNGNGIVVPDTVTVEFKEALVFALLGVLRIRGETNTLASITGSIRDAIGGAIYEGR